MTEVPLPVKVGTGPRTGASPMLALSAVTRRGCPMRVMILDDYQGAALNLAEWRGLGSEVEIEALTRHIADREELVSRLDGAEAVVAMRERTPFPADLLARLPKLRLLVTTGMRNAAIDLDACAARGIAVCGTEGLRRSTMELTWALILAVTRCVVEEDRAIRDGRWQHTLG